MAAVISFVLALAAATAPPRLAARPQFSRRAALVTACAGNGGPSLPGLQKEAARQLDRAHKKLSKAVTRAAACEREQAALLEQDDPSLEALEALPNCEELRAKADAEAERAAQLQALVDDLAAVAAPPTPAALASRAEALGVGDAPPARPPPPPRKPKGPRGNKTRLPYKVYESDGGAEIRVGRTAADNDELSTDPAHRDGDDWWLHAAGCPGSHVVVRADTVAAAELPRDVELDAAVLAAKYSKAALGGNVKVNLCRARQVSKPSGAKAGLVQLSGDVKTLRLNWGIEKRRLARWDIEP